MKFKFLGKIKLSQLNFLPDIFHKASDENYLLIDIVKMIDNV